MYGDQVWTHRCVPYRPLRKQLQSVDDSYAGRKTPDFGDSSFCRLFKPSPRPTSQACSSAVKEINNNSTPLGRRHQGADAFMQTHTANDILAQRKDSKSEIRRARKVMHHTAGESWRTMGIFSNNQEPHSEKLRARRVPCRHYTDRESPILGDYARIKEKVRSSVRVCSGAHATSDEMLRAMAWEVSRPADRTPCYAAAAQTPPLCAAHSMSTSLISKRTPSAPPRCSGSRRPSDQLAHQTSLPDECLSNGMAQQQACSTPSPPPSSPAENIQLPKSNDSVNSSNALKKTSERGGGGEGPARSKDNGSSISKAPKISRSSSCRSIQASSGKKGGGVGHVASSNSGSSRKTPFKLSTKAPSERQISSLSSRTSSATVTHSTVNGSRKSASAHSRRWEPFGGLTSEKCLCCSHD
eukprot:GEMP01022611.1.p1 GENE.GEMP01022611.1~~GEMP01022611.1.p1  ORF type:complete len:412 (+),score=51.19 GEMP01022611.1:209-1444(+)